MATIDWTDGLGGDFNIALNWSTGTVPGKADTAVLDNLGAPYTVLAQSGILGLLTVPNQVVSGIQTASNVTMDVFGGVDALDLLAGDTRFTATRGTAGGDNAGLIEIRNNIFSGPLGVLLGTTATLEIGGTFNNTGEIWINERPKVLGILDADQTANLQIKGAVTLTGGGQVLMSNEAENRIAGAGARPC